MEFNKRVVIVTGGSSGIGREIALSFSREAAIVVILDVQQENSLELVNLIKSRGSEASFFQVDVSYYNEVKTAFDQVVNKYGKIDILVNNAGISNNKITENIEIDEWNKVVGVNLNGAFHCSKAAIPYMKQRKFGKIINISSVGGKRISYSGGSAYTTTKAGILGFTRHLAYELAPLGINVNCVCPGGTLTPLYKELTDEEMISERKSINPVGELCTPEDIADAVLFLSSEKAKMIFGVSLDVDGGSLLGWYDVRKYYERRNKMRP